MNASYIEAKEIRLVKYIQKIGLADHVFLRCALFSVSMKIAGKEPRVVLVEREDITGYTFILDTKRSSKYGDFKSCHIILSFKALITLLPKSRQRVPYIDILLASILLHYCLERSCD
jgi:hypothetical protein